MCIRDSVCAVAGAGRNACPRDELHPVSDAFGDERADFPPNAPVVGNRPCRAFDAILAVSYTHLRAHETVLDLVCRLLLEKKKYCRLYTVY